MVGQAPHELFVFLQPARREQPAEQRPCLRAFRGSMVAMWSYIGNCSRYSSICALMSSPSGSNGQWRKRSPDRNAVRERVRVLDAFASSYGHRDDVVVRQPDHRTFSSKVIEYGCGSASKGVSVKK